MLEVDRIKVGSLTISVMMPPANLYSLFSLLIIQTLKASTREQNIHSAVLCKNCQRTAILGLVKSKYILF